MSATIQDLATKLNQSSLTLDEAGLGSQRLAELLSRAFLGKILELRDVNSPVSTDMSLQFQGAADLFLGVYKLPVRVMAFLHAEQLECVLLATLPERWDFSWGYPDLPEYIDSSDPLGVAKPSFFSELRFGGGLTALFSSYDFSQGATDEILGLLSGFAPAIDWATVLQGLNYRGEVNLASAPFMTLLSQFAGVATSIPVSGALYHTEFDDEIRLQLTLSLDTNQFVEDLPFNIGVSALMLSSSASLYAPEPGSGIHFLGHISFDESARNSYEVALFWPIGSKRLILSNVDSIPFPGLDKLLSESDPSHEALNEVLNNDWNAFQIHEIVLGLSWDPISVTNFWCAVGSPDGWSASFLPDDLKSLISVEGYLLRFDLRPRVQVSAQILFKIGGGIVQLSGAFPDLIFAGELLPHQEIDVSELIQMFLPAENGSGNSTPAMSSLRIMDLAVEANLKQNIYTFNLDIASAWEISVGGVKTLPLQRLRLSLEKEGEWTSVSLDSRCTIAGVGLNLYASHAGDNGTSEWTFSGKTAPGADIPFGDFMKDIALYFGGDENNFPRALETFVIRNLRVEFRAGAQSQLDALFHCEGAWTVTDYEGNSILVALYLTVTRKTDNGTRVTTFNGELTVGDLDFTVAFIDEATTSGASDLLVATYHPESGQQQIKLGDLIGSVAQGDMGLTMALDSVAIDVKDAIFAYSQIDEQKNFLFGFDIGARLSLADLPLVGKEFSADSNISIDNLQAVIAWKPFTEGEVKRLNALLPKGVNKLPETAKSSNGAGQADSTNGKTIVLQEGLNIEAALNLGNISRPLSLLAAGPSTTLPETLPTPTPTEGPTQMPESDAAPAPPIDTATWFKIQKSLGPVYFERIGVQYKDAALSFLLDAALSAAGLTLSLDGLSVSSPLNEFKPKFDLRGLGIDYRNDAVEIGGAFLKVAEKEYAGAALIKAKQLTLSALGMYKEMDDGHPSVFVYAVLDYPIGGPSFFYVTGLAAGFGYSRALKIPTIDKVASFSLVENARKGAGMPKVISDELRKMANDITPAPGENFLAIGLKFTSFKIVESFALLTVSFGNHFEMNLLGLSSLVAPANAGANVPPVAEAQLALKASFQPDRGFFGAQAQLTPNSYILSKDCHLTGGFAFYSWFEGSEHNGDFVMTLGGYHPNFKVPAHYPTVPRLGFNWQVNPQLSIKGDAYFALTASALMAGGHLEANWQSGSVRAWFKLGADFLIAWKPYHYEISAYVSIGADVTYELFGTQHLTVDVGADLRIWGPEFSGEATIHLWIISFTVSFGAGASQTPQPIDWPNFKSSFLPADNEVCSVMVTGGMIGKDSQDRNDLGVINPGEFSLATNSVIPSTTAQYALKNKKQAISMNRTPAKFGIGSMGVAAADLASTQTITIKREGNFREGNLAGEDEDFEYRPIFKKVPAGLWGESLKPELNGQQFIEDALSGFEIRPKAKSKPGETVAIERRKLQEDGFSGEGEYRWESVGTFAAAPFDNEQKRREELRKSLAAGAPGRNAILGALGFTADDIGGITLNAAQADDFLIAPQIEQN